jgi:translation elongation factor EF-1beta
MLHNLIEASPMSNPFWDKVMFTNIGFGLNKLKQVERYNENEEMEKGKVEQKTNANEKSDKAT